jgi:hypothetical protein
LEANVKTAVGFQLLIPLTVRIGPGTSPRRMYIAIQREQIECPWRGGVGR